MIRPAPVVPVACVSDDPGMEIQPADPAARRRALILLSALAGGGFVLLLGGAAMGEDLAAWVNEDPARSRARLTRIFTITTTSYFGIHLLFAAWSARLGFGVIRSQRFPPPGMAVVRDTRVITGKPARSRGAMIVVLPVAALVLAGYICSLILKLPEVVSL
jgi:hypothetical protein